MLLATPLFLAARAGDRLAEPLILSTASVVVILLGIAAAWLAPRLLDRDEESDKNVRLRVSAVLAVLAWGPLMAYQFANIPVLSTFRLSMSGADGEQALLVLGQIGVILFASIMAAVALWRVVVRSRREGHAIAPLTQLTPPVLFPAYIALSLAIVL